MQKEIRGGRRVIIILNEKEYVNNILRNKNIEPSKAYVFLSIYSRYLYHEKNIRKTRIIKELNNIMQMYYPHYNSLDWSATLEKYANKAGRYPLCECEGIWVTENELKTIEEIHNKVLERLSFSLLCLAKFKNFRNPNNNNWVNYSNGEIYSMACINTTAFDKDLKFNSLKELGLIEYAKKVDNLNIQVLFIDDNSKNALFVSDFRKLGYEWRLYKGEKYIRCADCNILVKNTNGKRRYCKDCADINKKKLDKIRMQTLRKAKNLNNFKNNK